MKKIYTTIAVFFSVLSVGLAQDSKQISDCMVTYSVSLLGPKTDDAAQKAMEGAVKTVYIKGAKSRSDLETGTFKQTAIYDSKTDSTIILKELGGSKYISYVTGVQLKSLNKKFDGIKFTNTAEHKTILGYDCIKSVAQLADGSTYTVYYTTAIVPSSTFYEFQFKEIPGFVLEYESEAGKNKVLYTASKISLSPVPVFKFDIPKAGYRVL